MTYRQLVYLVLDEIKLISGDSIINEDHIIFLADKYRPFLLKQYYDKELEKAIADNIYQEICLKLIQVPAISGEPCEGGTYLRSLNKIPKLMNIGNVNVTPLDFFQGINIAYISRNRLRYVGDNKWMKNIIYCAIGPDNYLYFKSSNPQFIYLEQVKFTGVFENSSEAEELSCDSCKCGDPCDPLDKEFPFEDHLYPQLTELILKEVLGAAYRPMDDQNDDKDNLADLHSFIRQNMKSNMAKQLGQ